MPVFYLLIKLKYHCTIEKFTDRTRNYLILSNHQTDFDQFFISAIFSQPVYFVALEDLFSMGFVSKLISWLAAPIPIMKGSNDVSAVMNSIRVAKEGGTVCLFPEGNRTYSGKTCFIGPQIAKLAKVMKLPIAFVRIEGGYGIKPRWSDFIRKGKMKASVCEVLEPQDYKELSNEDLYAKICSTLSVDDTDSTQDFVSEHIAEGIEKVLYYCPDCGITTFSSKGETFTCNHCHKSHKYLKNQRIKALEGKTFFNKMTDWYDAQEAFIRNLDLSLYHESSIGQDTVKLTEVIPCKKKVVISKKAGSLLFGDRIETVNKNKQSTWEFDDISAMTCVADHKLNIYHKDGLFQLSGDKHFNALKYCNIYYHHKYVFKDNKTDSFEFLGL